MQDGADTGIVGYEGPLDIADIPGPDMLIGGGLFPDGMDMKPPFMGKGAVAYVGLTPVGRDIGNLTDKVGHLPEPL